MRAVMLLLACWIAASGVARAEPAPAAPATAPATRADPAWRLYDEAFLALLQGQRRRAAELVVRLRREHPGHPATARANASPLAAAGVIEGLRRPRAEAPSSAAISELALFQTLHGVALGLELCVAAKCNSPEAATALALFGGSIGVVTSLKAFPRLTPGQRALLNGGTAWGVFHSIMGFLVNEPDTDAGVALGLLAGQVAGLTGGALLFSRRPTAGQVGLASSGGQWGAALVALMLNATSPTVGSHDLAIGAILGADAGLAGGAYLARLWPRVSRAQTLLLDAGGIVGGLGGGGIGVLISGSVGGRTTSLLAALGAVTGLAATVHFTRRWSDADADEDDGEGVRARAALLPVEGGRGGAIGIAGRW